MHANISQATANAEDESGTLLSAATGAQRQDLVKLKSVSMVLFVPSLRYCCDRGVQDCGRMNNGIERSDVPRNRCREIARGAVHQPVEGAVLRIRGGNPSVISLSTLLSGEPKVLAVGPPQFRSLT